MDELYFYDCNLNIKSFAGMLENPTQCYKFFWLDSIMQLVARGENEFTFLEVFAGMIADACGKGISLETRSKISRWYKF